MDLPRLKVGRKETMEPVYLKDRYTGTIVIGKSSTGKSTSLINWWWQDHMYGNAKVLIDPSGFLSKEAYSISEGMYCSQDTPISINPMRAKFTYDQIIDMVAETINHMVTRTTPNQLFTVKMRDIFGEGALYCLNHGRKSLLNVLDYVKNMQGNAETREGIISRLTFILSDKRMEKLLCGNDSVDWGELIKNRKTFILDASGFSKEKMIFLGTLVTQGIVSYFRYSKPKEYLPISLYIDEAHNFISPSMFDILKEGRKYSVSCILATQDFAVIEEPMTRVMLNSGNILSYRVGSHEGHLIAKELDIKPQEIQFLEKYHVAYLIGKDRGIAKAIRPPLFKEKEPPVKVEPKREAKPSWFVLESYQPAQTPI